MFIVRLGNKEIIAKEGENLAWAKTSPIVRKDLA